jgi:hypothetical protein
MLLVGGAIKVHTHIYVSLKIVNFEDMSSYQVIAAEYVHK